LMASKKQSVGGRSALIDEVRLLEEDVAARVGRIKSLIDQM